MSGTIVAVLRTAFVLGYPVLVFVGIGRWGTRPLALLLLVFLIANLLLSMKAKKKEALRIALPIALSIATLMAFSAWLNSSSFMLFLPALVNLSLLLTFGVTLRKGALPMIERFARLQHQDFSDAELRWCRRLTFVWAGFFLANILMIGWLALCAPLAWWAMYTGLGAYVLMGVLAAVEYILRKRNFGRYGKGLHDRALARLFGGAQ